MKKITKKVMAALFSLLMVNAIFPANAFAADKLMNLTLRIEGIDRNIYYGQVEVPYTGTLTLQDALTYIDSKNDSISITGVDTAYITDINGETAGQFGGWDGWLYQVNGVDASVGVDGTQLSDGDRIVFYYGDPFGAGMQFPAADTSKLSKGILRFTSSDTTYDADYNATVTVNPVAGATVTWSNGDETKDYVTDKNGEISIDQDQLTEGAHAVQISKVSEAGIPLVLRYAPDYTVNVSEVVSSVDPVADTTADEADTEENAAAANTDSQTVTQEDTNDIPKTGDNTGYLAALYGIAAAGAFVGVIYNRKKVFMKKGVYEK